MFMLKMGDDVEPYYGAHETENKLWENVFKLTTHGCKDVGCWIKQGSRAVKVIVKEKKKK